MLKDKNTKYTINASVNQNAIESADEMINILPLVDFLSMIWESEMGETYFLRKFLFDIKLTNFLKKVSEEIIVKVVIINADVKIITYKLNSK